MDRGFFSRTSTLAITFLLAIVIQESLAAPPIPAVPQSATSKQGTTKPTLAPVSAPAKSGVLTSSPSSQSKIIIKSAGASMVKDKLELPSPVITYKGTTISADKGVVTGKKDSQIGTFTGNVKVIQEGILLTCQSMEVQFKQDKVIATGNVVLVREEDRKEEKSEPKKAKTTVKCDKAEFFTQNNDFIAMGNANLEDVVGSDWTKASAKQIAYVDKEKKLTLIGSSRITKSDGTAMKAETISYWTQSENMQASGAAEIETFVE